jgi:hypothetical protein
MTSNDISHANIKKKKNQLQMGHYECSRKKFGYNLSPLTVVCMRILVHLSLLMTTQVAPSRQSKHINSSSPGAAAGKVASELSTTCTFLLQDLNTFGRILGLKTVNDLIMVLHLLLKRLDYALTEFHHSIPDQLIQLPHRSEFEKKFHVLIVEALFPGGTLSASTRHQLKEGKENCGDAAFMNRFFTFFGADSWELLSEASPPSSSPPSLAVMGGKDISSYISQSNWIWRLRKVTCLKEVRYWLLANSNRSKQHPFLVAFLNEEEENHDDDEEGGDDSNDAIIPKQQQRKKKRKYSVLELVRCAADILAWHGVLFEAIGDRSLTRSDAMSFTNEDAIGW